MIFIKIIKFLKAKFLKKFHLHRNIKYDSTNESMILSSNLILLWFTRIDQGYIVLKHGKVVGSVAAPSGVG